MLITTQYKNHARRRSALAVSFTERRLQTGLDADLQKLLPRAPGRYTWVTYVNPGLHRVAGTAQEEIEL